MKKLLTALLFCGLTLNSLAGETWRKESYDNGEVAYASGWWGNFNTIFLIGLKGVGIEFSSPTGRSIKDGDCMIAIDDKPADPCKIVDDLFTRPGDLANRLAHAKKATLKVRICNNSPICRWTVAGGNLEEISWEWDEPLTTTFPDFKPYPVKK